MFKFSDSKFSPTQRRNYKRLRFILNFSSFLTIALIVLPFAYEIFAMFVKDVSFTDISVDFPNLWMIVFALVIGYFLRKFAINRCLNCYQANALEEISESIANDWSKYGIEKTKSDAVMVLAVKQLKCTKCSFECEQLVVRTGHLSGIARMSRDIKRGGKARNKGESYTSWWRRNR
jgi:hypothetical protein